MIRVDRSTVAALTFTFLLLALLILGARVAQADPAAKANSDTAAPSPRSEKQTIRVRVELPGGKPAVGAKIHASIWSNEPAYRNRDYVCDGSGAVVVALPQSLDILRLWARLDGYVPLFANWWQPGLEGRMAPVTGDVPKEFTFKLIPGTAIGGLVKDEEGKPIPRVKVEVMLASPREQPDKRPIYDTWLAWGDAARTTDAQGRWTLDNVPPGENVEVRIKLTHPDFISDYRWGMMQSIEKVTMASLRQQTAALVMARGIRVSGTLTDPSGKPVSGAVVAWGDDPYGMQGSQEVRTDGRGVYRFAPLPPGRMRITVMAQRWSPEMKGINITFDNPPVDFQLKAGKTLRLRFVDDTGVAVPGVSVTISGWRGAKSLYNHKHPNVLDTKIPAAADKSGVYEWSWAPEDEVESSFYKQGYRDTRSRLVTADGSEHEIRLARE